MAGPETGDRRTVRLFAALDMGGFELGKVYLTSLNLTKCYKLVDINIPVYKEDLSDLAKYTEMFTFGQNRKKSHKIIFKCRFLPNKI